MAANTGRTVNKHFKFQIEDSGGTFRDIPILTVNGVGIAYDEEEMMAIQDAMHGFLPGHGVTSVDITGPLDTTAAQTASGSGAVAALSGGHVVLPTVNGGVTPLGFACYFGMRHPWETGEPVFGLASTAANGVLVFNYEVDPASMLYSASIRMFPGSAAPAWGTAAIS